MFDSNAQLIDNLDEDQARETELNLGSMSKEDLINRNICSEINQDENISQAFETMRRGYPNQPADEQCQGREFREASGEVMKTIAQRTVEAVNGQHLVILLPWRAGLAFGKSYAEIGQTNYFHLSSKRDEITLLPKVDFAFGNISATDTVVIADPMLATGNTIVDAVDRVIQGGVPENQIIINTVVASPVGVTQLHKHFPEMKIIVGCLDDKLDSKGYIVPGLGDFGDKYFAEMSQVDLENFVKSFHLPEDGQEKLLTRFKSQQLLSRIR